MDLTTVDELLTTTRAVRRRLDMERDVPPEVIEECVALSLQAPSGGNSQGWRFLIVRDEAKRSIFAYAYRKGWYDAYGADADRRRSVSPEAARIVDSAQYLADNMQHVPVL